MSRLSSPDPVELAVAASRRGEVVVVLDDDRENEADLVMAAEFADTERVAFFLRHTSGPSARVCPSTLPLQTRDDLTLDAAGASPRSLSVDQATMVC